MDLVKFLEKQVRISTDPVFGNIQDQTVDGAKRKVTPPLKLKATGSFATNTDTIEPKFTSKIPNQSQGLCLFCNRGGHTLESCYALKKKPHRDKIDFLKEKGICFGCLMKGHMSKDCKRRLICNECDKTHPGLLHITREENGKPREQSSEEMVSSLQACGHIGAGSDECRLSIAPVKIKSNTSDKTI